MHSRPRSQHFKEIPFTSKADPLPRQYNQAIPLQNLVAKGSPYAQRAQNHRFLNNATKNVN
jgi:hypothetical protein